MEKYEEVTKLLMTIGKTNGKKVEYNHILKQVQTLGVKIKETKEQEKKDTTSPLLKYPRLRRHFLILTSCWAGFYMAYLVPVYNLKNLHGNEFINFFLISIVELPGNFLFWFLMHNCGRRWSASLGFIVIGIVCLFPLFNFMYSDTVSSVVIQFLMAGVFMVTDQQGSELFPTVFRASGMGLGKTLAMTIMMFIPYIVLLSRYGKEIPFLVVSLTSFTVGILSSFLPETLNKNLPQTLTDSEEFGKDQKYFSWIRKSRKLHENETRPADSTKI